MKIFRRLVFLLLMQLCLTSTAIPVELYPFTEASQKQQFSQLTNEIRCLICQNETIADSNAPIAKDLRQKVYEMIKAGDSSVTIKQFLLNRYGDFILFKPRFNSQTLLLWIAPILFLALGFFMLSFHIRRKKKPGTHK